MAYSRVGQTNEREARFFVCRDLTLRFRLEKLRVLFTRLVKLAMWEVQLTAEVGRDYDVEVFTLIYCSEGVATELGTEGGGGGVSCLN